MPIRFLSTLLLALLPLAAAAAEAPADPLGSVQWSRYHRAYFSDGPVVFDERVRVLAPATAEDSMQVPITVDARGLDDVHEVVVIADYNPIPLVLRFRPEQAQPFVALRIKLQQESPIRAAARTADGTWHVGGVWVDAAGGGCTLPSLASAKPDWAARLGEIYGRAWPDDGTTRRVRVRLMHPMDTGLANGIPRFHVEQLALTDAAGGRLLSLKVFEPVSENPVFGFDLHGATLADGPLELSGRDNNANRFLARLTP